MISKSIRFTLILAILGNISCVKYKHLVLLNQDETNQKNSFAIPQLEEYVLDHKDQLYISVSTTDDKSLDYFSKGNGQSAVSSNSGESGIFLQSYLVDHLGNINLPIIGPVKAKGSTINQFQDSLQSKLAKYYKYSIVDVRLMSFRVSALGEVNSQGTQIVYRNSLNLLEAIALFNGFTEMAKRNEVEIYRKQDGQTIKRTIDFTSNKLLEDSWFYLRPGDTIYVKPLKTAALRSNTIILSTFVSIISLSIVALSLITNARR